MVFTGKYEYYSESSDEEINDGELDETYKRLLTHQKEACMVVEKQKETISALLLEKEKRGSTVAGLEEEVILLNSKLDNMTRFVHMLNNGSKALGEII